MPLLNIDWRVLLTDATGTALGTSGNPIFTSAAAAPGTTNVQGVQAAGAAITENPVLIAGQNAGNVKLWSLTSGGLGLMAGGLAHNNAAPGSDFLEVLPALANAAVPTYTEGNSVLASVDLKGNLRTLAGGFTPSSPTCTFTRPANVTAYTIGDEVGTSGTAPTTVTVGRYNGASGVIQGASVFYSSYSALVPSLVVLLFSATVTLAGDNAQLSLSDSDALKMIGYIALTANQPTAYSAGAPTSAGGVYLTGQPTAPIHFVCGASEQTIYACLVTLNAFTPIANSETLTLTLQVEQN